MSSPAPDLQTSCSWEGGASTSEGPLDPWVRGLVKSNMHCRVDNAFCLAYKAPLWPNEFTCIVNYSAVGPMGIGCRWSGLVRRGETINYGMHISVLVLVSRGARSSCCM